MDRKLVREIALAMARSEGWTLERIGENETNPHLKRLMQLATTAVEVIESQEEVSWQNREWELEVAGLKSQQKLWSDPPFTEDGECLLPQEF